MPRVMMSETPYPSLPFPPAQAFVATDADRSGHVSIAELRASLRATGLIDEHELRSLCAAVDVNGDGEVSYGEFKDAALGMALPLASRPLSLRERIFLTLDDPGSSGLARSCSVRYITAQHSTAQHSTMQYSTVQYSTVQYITHASHYTSGSHGAAPFVQSSPGRSTPFQSISTPFPVQSSPVQSIPVHFIPLHSTPLRSTPLHSIPVHSSPVQ